jgi:CheY-like chemotaxis protein
VARTESHPAEVKIMSLEECLNVALQQNRRRPISQFALAVAEAQHRQALSGYWPQIDFKGGYERLSNPLNFLFPSSSYSIPRRLKCGTWRACDWQFGFGSRKILVAEDNTINQIVTERMLVRLGHEVDMASSGAAAIQKVQQNRYDLLLMDVNMPGMDGIQATKLIRNLATPNARIPIVALTASATTEDRSQCFSAGMDDYISKPVTSHALRGVLDRWADASRSKASVQPEPIPNRSPE